MPEVDAVKLTVFGYPKWEADSEGNVYKDGQIVTGFMDDGYISVCPNGPDKVKRSILVCTAWHGPKPIDKDLCAHKDDVRLNDSPENLYWATHKENSRDAVRNGRHPGWHPGLIHAYEQHARGEKVPGHKLTEKDVLEIRSLQASGTYNMNELAYIYGVSNTTIKKIVRRLKWAHI